MEPIEWNEYCAVVFGGLPMPLAVCPLCGALVSPAQKDRHSAWHQELRGEHPTADKTPTTKED